MIYSEETLYCAKYLAQKGIGPKEFADVLDSVNLLKNNYVLVLDQQSFYMELAKKLIELWPKGSKNGSYSWRSTPEEIAKRLEILWKTTLKDKVYTVEDCLSAARRYLSQFENDTKYMKTLKYFIIKQNSYTDPKTGKIHYTSVSTLANLLADKSSLDEEFEFNESMGELI